MTTAANAIGDAVLGLEVGVSDGLLRSHRVVDPAARTELAALSSRPQRDGLILTAAHTVFPEASVLALPRIARAELDAGLIGPLRTTLAEVPTKVSDEERLENLSELLIVAVAEEYTAAAALDIAMRVHLSRVALGIVPGVVGFACLSWYGCYAAANPSDAVFGRAEALVADWTDADAADRASVEAGMRDIIAQKVGPDPTDPLDLAV